MPVAIERISVNDMAPIGSLRERRLRRGAVGDRSKALEIGLVNNMPDAATLATERQFSNLLAAASGRFDVRLHLFALSEVPRSYAARNALSQSYGDARELRRTRLDALIVTGAEPVAPELAQEPYWRALTELIDWADANTFSTILSCLAAHAGVQHLDGVARRALVTKCSGIFAFDAIARHPLLAGLEGGLSAPHSRRNGLDREELLGRGYQVLTYRADAGVDVFVKQKRSLLVFLQGHPEYGDESLAREYRRDMGRFLQGEQNAPPAIPANYFPSEVERSLAAFGERATRERRPALMREFPEAGAFGPGDAPWRKAAAQLYGNWLALIAERKAEAAPIAAVRWGG
jgi:homoserine O-succinyltransferase/O-acetyltransferase